MNKIDERDEEFRALKDAMNAAGYTVHIVQDDDGNAAYLVARNDMQREFSWSGFKDIVAKLLMDKR